MPKCKEIMHTSTIQLYAMCQNVRTCNYNDLYIHWPVKSQNCDCIVNIPFFI